MFREAVDEVSYLFKGELLDCEGLGKRNSLCSGRLLVLDRMIGGNYYGRTNPIRLALPEFSATDAMHGSCKVYSVPYFFNTVEDIEWRLRHWKAFNHENDCIFYEGVVSKRTDVPYIYGETPYWNKFRFTYKA
jgi:hypothetical protein